MIYFRVLGTKHASARHILHWAKQRYSSSKHFTIFAPRAKLAQNLSGDLLLMNLCN